LAISAAKNQALKQKHTYLNAKAEIGGRNAIFEHDQETIVFRSRFVASTALDLIFNSVMEIEKT
jgi:hypothetical protein